MLRRILPLALLALAAAAGFAPARGDDPLPTGEKVLADYVEATGGKDAYLKIKNRVSKGSLEVAGAGIKGKLKVVEAEPNKQLTEAVLGDLGTQIEGIDGKVVWEISPITGAKLFDGEEKENKLLEATFNDEIHWKRHYTKLECTGVEDVDGKPAYKVVATPKVGKPSTSFYDKKSHLLLKSINEEKGPMGEMTVESFPADYKKVDGLLIPHKVVQKVLTQEIVVTIDEIKHNVDLPADTFKLPKEIQDLVDKDKKP